MPHTQQLAPLPFRFARPLALIAPLALMACASDDAVPVALPQPTPEMAKWAAQCADGDAWDKPGPPFRISDNSYYVGTCGITAILITGDEGHILIDGGPEGAAGSIAANIEALGFRLPDVKILLHSHEHFDHVAGLAELQRRTGARLLASERAAPVLSSGEAAADDPQAGTLPAFPAAQVDGVVSPGQPVTLGALSLTPVATPGHTPGALTWHWRGCAAEDCPNIVYADSLSPISGDGYRFSDHPDVLRGFREGIVRLASLDCDILLTPHPSASAMRDRLLSGTLVDRSACARYAANIEDRLDARLEEESE